MKKGRKRSERLQKSNYHNHPTTAFIITTTTIAAASAATPCTPLANCIKSLANTRCLPQAQASPVLSRLYRTPEWSVGGLRHLPDTFIFSLPLLPDSLLHMLCLILLLHIIFISPFIIFSRFLPYFSSFPLLHALLSFLIIFIPLYSSHYLFLCIPSLPWLHYIFFLFIFLAIFYPPLNFLRYI